MKYSMKFHSEHAEVHPSDKVSTVNVTQTGAPLQNERRESFSFDCIPNSELSDQGRASIERTCVDIIAQLIIPFLLMSVISTFPLTTPEASGFSLGNIFNSLYVPLAAAPIGGMIFYLLRLVFPVTFKQFVIAYGGFYCLGNCGGVSLLAMALGYYPFPLHILFQASGWASVGTFGVYFQYPKQLRTAQLFNDFLKFHFLFWANVGYFFVCGIYLLVFMAAANPMEKAVVSVIYTVLSIAAKKAVFWFVALILRNLSADLAETVASAEDELKLNMFYFMELTHELFTTMSMTDVSDLRNATLMVMLDFVPLCINVLKLTRTVYEYRKKRKPLVYQNYSFGKYQIDSLSVVAVQLLAETGSCVGFFTLAYAFRYGNNAEFYPLRGICDHTFHRISLFVAGYFASLVCIIVLLQVVISRLYRVSLFRVTATLVQRNRMRLLFTAIPTTIFPLTLMLYHGNILALVNPSVYDPQSASNCTTLS